VFLAALLGLLMSLVWLGQRAGAAFVTARPDAHTSASTGTVSYWPRDRAGTSAALRRRAGRTSDEERLDIVVKLSTGETLRLEPATRGGAIHDLVRSLQEAWGQQAHHVGGAVSRAVTPLRAE
jgi:hypothetical protein